MKTGTCDCCTKTDVLLTRTESGSLVCQKCAGKDIWAQSTNLGDYLRRMGETDSNTVPRRDTK